MINQLKMQIKTNLNKLDDMLDLMNHYSDEELDNLYKAYEKLLEESKEIQSKVNQLVNHVN